MNEMSSIKNNFVHYINHIIDYNRISHAYLIEVDNKDDYSFIYSFIKMILCNLHYEDLSSSDNPIIHQIDSGVFPDLTIVSSDGNTISKSLIKDLQKEFNHKTLSGNKKIYIIEDAQKMNDSSSNTILKFLEEPEEDIIAFLVTDNRYHVLETILSRCQVLSLKENNYHYTLNDEFIDFLDCVLNPTKFFVQYKYYMKNVFLDKDSVKDKFIEVENVLIDYLGCSDYQNMNSDIVSLISHYQDGNLVNVISIIEDELNKLKYNINFKLWLDGLFSKLIGGKL